MTEPQDIPGDDALAAEYVLGLLEDDARDGFDRRLETDAALRQRVYGWEAHFAALADDIAPVAPPAAVKARVMAEIGGTKSKARWSPFAWLAPTLLAAALALFAFFGPSFFGPDFDPTLHASLASADGSLQIEAGYAPEGDLFKVLRPQGNPRPGRALELWVIGPGGGAPVSLGVMPEDREALFPISPEIAALIDGGTLAVSDEPLGGSPTGAPTGDILAAGEFFDI